MVHRSAVIGACDEFVSSGRLDNQGTCYMATRALVDSLAQSQEDYARGVPTHAHHSDGGGGGGGGGGKTKKSSEGGGSDNLARDSCVRMISMFDHEEVGSLSAQGAESPFFEETLQRAAAALGVHDYCAFKARSFQISSDMAHAVR